MLQKKFNTNQRAQAFYTNQVLERLNSRMVEFVVNQEIVFVSTADAKGDCDCSCAREKRDLYVSSMIGPSSTRNTGATA